MDPKLQCLEPFWYPVLPVLSLTTEPRAVMLLGRPLVLWRREDGQLGALDDRCRHRSASLAGGRIGANGDLQCPYHGWTFDTEGRCREIPQQPGQPIPERCHTRAYRVQERHGLVWVCLADEARLPIPDLAGLTAVLHRRIEGFHEQWQCSAFRVIENGLDNFHHYFVHRGVLDALSPVPDPIDGGIIVTADGLTFSIPLRLSSNAVLEATVGDHRGELQVERHVRWLAPLGLTLELAWPNGRQQCIVLFAVPRDEHTCTILRFYLRNDREDEVSAASVIALERALIDQDRRILEALPTHLDPFPSGEQLIVADQPIARMRQLLQKFLAISS
jgi:phenylpropionate dioxygenase-like ring-hydroxylating dioxygenase large terminal subunit